MTSTMKTTEILKADERGRVMVPRERREALLDEFECSGLSGAGFAAHYGLKYSSFAGWVQRRRTKRETAPLGGGKGGSVQWLEAVADTGLPAGVLTLRLPGGARMDLTHRQQLPLAVELLRMVTAAAGSTQTLPC